MRANSKAAKISEERFEAYIERLGRAVGHEDRKEPLHAYCVGLLLPGDRKSVEPMAAQLDPAHVQARHQSMHHFVAKAPWSDEAVLSVVGSYVLPKMEAKAPISDWLIDDTGLPKKGELSVGVSHQYCGQLGKTMNCQVAVTLSLANDYASLPVAFRLYLPESWANAPARREKVGIPEDLSFQTKPQLALEQLCAALAEGLPKGVVGADAGFGNNTEFRDALTEELKLQYIVGILSTTTVWPEGKGPLPPKPYSGRGQPPKRLQRDEEHQPISVKELAMQQPESAYRMSTWREGTRGMMRSRFCALRVRAACKDHRRTEPRQEEWLLIEWPKGEKEPTKYWLSTLPKKTSVKKLVLRAKARWRIERDYQELKDGGLGHYEGRGWRGFHHHATLCIATYGFLVAERLFFSRRKAGAKRQLEVPALPEGFRPRGAPDPTGATQSELDRLASRAADCETDETASSLPVLSTKKRRAPTHDVLN
jgi:SRSO17 transposase